ncbi:MAG: M23 family metallopeptidase [Bacteroidaceae bacterium]|nr:M23 family metallopeptidase [Bacteroidaceae bacterium]
MRRILIITLITILAIVGVGMLIPQNLKMPVVGADSNSYNHETFWYEGWGTSIVHKGIDVFARRGTRVNSATIGIVLLTAEYGKGGKFVVVLGPKWRLHYYAHLDEIKTKRFALVNQNTEIGTVGNTGNAITTPAHLHYGIGTLIPYPWRMDDAPLGHQKAFYLNPIDYLK